ncbi:maleylpyruvate isomerase family mycothiol-dependent enzyme [Kibdelosporangium lantanae]
MDHETALAHIVEQAEALRTAAVAAGPAAPVSTCPKWTVHDLVSHIAGVHSWVCAALLLTPDSDRPTWPTPPDEWDELLTWWDTTRATMLDRLAAADPAKPVWGFVPEFRTVGWWGRRQAHETAIHRLDAEHAAHETVPTLIFDPEFASDGIDEVVAMMSPFRARVKRPEVTVEGTLLIHAADAGHAWLLQARDGVVEAGPTHEAATDTDASLVGTADAVYRAVWKRPSTAVLTGNAEMLSAINGG